MSRVFAIGLILVTCVILIGCENSTEVLPIEYTIEELLPTMDTFDVSLTSGILRSDLIDEEYYAGIFNNEFYINDIQYTYLRYLSPNDEYLLHLNMIAILIEENFDVIYKIFDKPEDIGNIVVNAELGILSILPKDTSNLNTGNTVILNLTDSDLVIGRMEYSGFDFQRATGFDFRNIFVSQFNIEYSEESIEIFADHLWFVYDWLTDEISFIDIVIETNNNETKCYFMNINSNESRSMIGELSWQVNFTSPEIPIILRPINLESEDIIIEYNTDYDVEDVSILFYK